MSALTANQKQQLKQLVADGNKIAAIGLYREMTSVGLKEAKDAVEAIVRGEPANLSISSQVSYHDPFLENRIRRLLAERKKIEAIKIYREAHHCGLKEAKDAVDLIQAGLRRTGDSQRPFVPSMRDDLFVENAQENWRRLIIWIALLGVVLGGLALYLVLQGGV